MNSFGLGLVLTFKDMATSGMQKAINAFHGMSAAADATEKSTSSAVATIEQLTAAGYSMLTFGDQMVSVGNKILGTFTSAIGAVTETGTTILTAKTQLSSLYGSMEEGEKTLNRIKEYAKTSIFNFEDLIPSVIMLKANGIEAFDAITSSTGKSKQLLMDYAADLAAFNPQMRNAYGTGIQAAMGAINEYIAEGNTVSLKRGASLDILQLLGEEKGSTIEERSRQIADLLEKLNMVGMTASLAGTPMQRLSNAQDVLFDVLTRISDSGVFEKYTELIATFTDYIFAIPDEELQSIAETIAGALTMLLTPVEYVVKAGLFLVDMFRKLIKEHPSIAKVVTVIGLLSGVLLVVGGTVLKFAGNLFLLMAAIQGFKTLGLASMLGSVLTSLGPILLIIGAIIAVSMILYKVWKDNIGGIADIIRNTIGVAFEKVSIIIDAFFDNTLSEDRWNRASELGILPFIEKLLDFKYKVHQTFIAIRDTIVSKTEEIIESFLGFWNKVSPYVKMWASFVLGQLTEMMGDIKQWFSTAWDGWLGNIVTTIATIVTNIAHIVKKVIPVILGIIGILLPIFIFIIDKLKALGLGLLSLVGTIISVILSSISGFISGVKTMIDGIVQFLQGIIEFITGVFTGDWEKAWTGVKDIFIGIFESLKGFFGSFINIVSGGINGITSAINGKKIPFTDIVINIPQIPMLATGGYVKNEGLSYLHPNEVVVNSPMTKGLGAFLNDYQNSKGVVPPLEDDEDEEVIYIDIPGDDDVPRLPVGKPAMSSTSSDSYDYSVTFGPGSIVIQAGSMSDAELNAAADKLMRIIARKQQLQRMSTRKDPKEVLV